MVELKAIPRRPAHDALRVGLGDGGFGDPGKAVGEALRERMLFDVVVGEQRLQLLVCHVPRRQPRIGQNQRTPAVAVNHAAQTLVEPRIVFDGVEHGEEAVVQVGRRVLGVYSKQLPRFDRLEHDVQERGHAQRPKASGYHVEEHPRPALCASRALDCFALYREQSKSFDRVGEIARCAMGACRQGSCDGDAITRRHTTHPMIGERGMEIFEAGSTPDAHQKASVSERLLDHRAALERGNVHAKAGVDRQEMPAKRALPADQRQASSLTTGLGEELLQLSLSRAADDLGRLLVQGAGRAQALRLGFHRAAR